MKSAFPAGNKRIPACFLIGKKRVNARLLPGKKHPLDLRHYYPIAVQGGTVVRWIHDVNPSATTNAKRGATLSSAPLYPFAGVAER